MSDTVNDPLEPIDPPDNQGGGTDAEMSLDTTGTDADTIDPPDNQGGGST